MNEHRELPGRLALRIDAFSTRHAELRELSVKLAARHEDAGRALRSRGAISDRPLSGDVEAFAAACADLQRQLTDLASALKITLVKPTNSLDLEELGELLRRLTRCREEAARQDRLNETRSELELLLAVACDDANTQAAILNLHAKVRQVQAEISLASEQASADSCDAALRAAQPLLALRQLAVEHATLSFDQLCELESQAAEGIDRRVLLAVLKGVVTIPPATASNRVNAAEASSEIELARGVAVDAAFDGELPQAEPVSREQDAPPTDESVETVTGAAVGDCSVAPSQTDTGASTDGPSSQLSETSAVSESIDPASVGSTALNENPVGAEPTCSEPPPSSTKLFDDATDGSTGIDSTEPANGQLENTAASEAARQGAVTADPGQTLDDQSADVDQTEGGDQASGADQAADAELAAKDNLAVEPEKPEPEPEPEVAEVAGETKETEVAEGGTAGVFGADSFGVPEPSVELEPPAELEPSVELEAPPDYAPATASPQELARRLPTDGSTAEFATICNDLIWALLREGRLGLALHLANYLELHAVPCEAPARLIESLSLSLRIRSSVGGEVKRLSDRLHGALGEPSSRDEHRRETLKIARSLLALAAGMRPALLARETGAVELLRSVRVEAGYEALAQLRDAVTDSASRNLLLTPKLLRGNRNIEQWQQERDALTRECRDWLDNNRMCKVIYQPTTVVWRRWLADNGPLGKHFAVVLDEESTRQQRDAVREEAKHWVDRQYVDKLLHSSDLEERGVGARRRPIDARAKGAVREKCSELVELLCRRFDHFDSRPEDSMNWVDEQARECRKKLLSLLPQCQQLVAEELSRAADPLPVVAAGAALRRALENLQALLAPTEEEGLPRSSIFHEMNFELLRVPELQLDDQWAPVDPESAVVLEGVRQCLTGPAKASLTDWMGLVSRCWEQGDFPRSARIIEHLREQASPDHVLEELQEKHDEQLDSNRKALARRKDQLARELESSRLKGLIDENSRLELSGRVNAVDHEETLQIGRDGRRLDELAADLEGRKQVELSAIREKLDAPEIAVRFPEAHQRIKALLDSHDLVTAHEYLSIIKSNNTLPEPLESRPGADFFPEFLEKALEFLTGKHRLEARVVARRVRDRERLGPYDLSRLLTPGEAKRLADVIEGWRRLKNNQGSATEELQALFELIGFTVLKVRKVDSDRGRWYEVETTVLERREFCPLPDFGSRCQGLYRVILLENQPLEEEILRDARCDHRGQAVIALFFGTMSPRRRRDLAHALRGQPTRRLLVLDDALLLYVGLQKRRLAAFFFAAGRFTVAEPYTTTAGLVPPEMFFGRSVETKSVIDRDGTNLVYGGRQLGKTALLQEVRRRHHDPDHGVIVEWIDLRYGEHLGLTRPLDDIWSVIASRLHAYGIVTPSTRKPESIQREVQHWLDQDPSRRIVLLLDEADIFLSSDAKEQWPRVGRLKTMMDLSQRRFKVVFAGLHNVQRASHDVNTPMAHLGQSLCIGPFLSKEEIRDAAEMVTLPFLAMGYEFDSNDLYGRVLAQTNFYPSLIQLACKQLLKRLTADKTSRPDPGKTPPYMIRLEDIEDAYADPELRNQIRDRFRWTLELDNRYRVIALSLALETLERRDESADGFSLAEIREWALDSWPQGFAESQSNDAFRSILDEMVELGVLRPIGYGSYALRSPNVISLLGGQEHILDTLYDAAGESPKIEYEAASFRRVFSENERWRRSPLTAAQESILLNTDGNGLFLLFGAPAAGLDDAEPFLERLARASAVSSCSIQRLAGLDDSASFQRELELGLEQRENGVTLFLISNDANWNDDWVEIAGRMLRKRSTTSKRLAKVLFLGGPAEAWTWSGLPENRLKELRGLGMEEMSLPPWSETAVQQWKKEAEFGENTDEDGRRFRQATGFWRRFLQEAGRCCIDRPHDWKNVLDEYSRNLNKEQAFREGFDPPHDCLPALQAMAEYGDSVTDEDLAALLEGGAARVCEPRFLRWADSLCYIRHCGEGRWQLDAFIRNLLSQVAGP